MRWLALVILLPLAGCIDGANDEAADPEAPIAIAPAPEPIPIELPDCTILEAFVPVSTATAQSLVPDGFTIDDNAGSTLAVIGAAECPAGARGFLALRVTADDATFAGRDGDGLFFEPEHTVVPGTALADAFHQIGATPWLGNVTVAQTLLGGSASYSTANGTHTITPIAGPTLPTSIEMDLLSPFREYVPADGGAAYLQATYAGSLVASTTAAIVMIETAPDTVARLLIGPSVEAPALTITATAFADATVGFVAYG